MTAALSTLLVTLALGAVLGAQTPARARVSADPAAPPGATLMQPDNVLLIIADDFGREKLGAYGVHPSPASTPVLDALSEHGVTFTRFYTQPVCSPTRAAILTGRQAFRTGIGTSVPWFNCEASDNGCFDWPIDQEVTLPRALRATHFSVAVGKWHLSEFFSGRGFMHPIRAGFGAFSGHMQNFGGGGSPYYVWSKVQASSKGASVGVSQTYATTANVDDTLLFIDRARGRPWFVWLAFNSAHAPFHSPPAELQPVTGAGPNAPKPKQAKAMVEALDTELGRLLGSLRPAELARTWVVFLADNGPASVTVEAPYPPFGKGKPFPFEGNIHMPLIVAGPGVVAPGREADQLVHAVDVYASVCDMAGVPVPAGAAVDSVSFYDALIDTAAGSRRDVVFSERFLPNGPPPHAVNHFAVTDGRWKWGRLGNSAISTGGLSLYDLLNDSNETNNLLESPALDAEQQAALEFLMQRRVEILASHGGGL